MRDSELGEAISGGVVVCFGELAVVETGAEPEYEVDACGLKKFLHASTLVQRPRTRIVRKIESFERVTVSGWCPRHAQPLPPGFENPPRAW